MEREVARKISFFATFIYIRKEKNMENLNQIVELFLRKNGITSKYFASYIGCEYTKCVRWIRGEHKKLNNEQIRKTHEFLDGNFLKSVQAIIEEEG